MATAPNVTVTLTQNGTQSGILTVADTSQLRPSSTVYLSSNNQPTLTLKILSVLSSTTFQVGPNTAGVYNAQDCSAYLTANNAAVTQYTQGFYGANLATFGKAAGDDITSDGTNIIIDTNLKVNGSITSQGSNSATTATSFTATAAASNNGFILSNNNARLQLGAGANTYMYGDGTNVDVASGLNVSGVISTLGAISATLTGTVPDGASAVGVILNNSTTLANAGAKLLSIQNNGTEKAYVSLNGLISSAATGNAFQLPTNAKIDLNGGNGVAYVQSDGNNVNILGTNPPGLTVADFLASNTGKLNAGGTAPIPWLIRGNGSATGSVAAKIGNLTAMTGGNIAEFYKDNFTTRQAFIDFAGNATFQGSVTATTALNLPQSAPVDFSGGNNQARLSFDGTNINGTGSVVWNLLLPSNLYVAGGSILANATATSLSLNGKSAASGPAVKVGNQVTLTSGNIIEFYKDNFTTKQAFIDFNGNATFNGVQSATGFNVVSGANIVFNASNTVLYTAGNYPITIQPGSTNGVNFAPGGTTIFSIDQNGRHVFSDYIDNSGTPGNTTANAVTGRAAIANAASACVVTNSRATATSIIRVQLESTGTGVANVVVDTQSSGSFTVRSVNGTGVVTVTTANTKFSWVICN